MKLREKPLIPWMVAEVDGKNLLCHCNCMAELGETYLLSGWHFVVVIEACVQRRESISVTPKSILSYFYRHQWCTKCQNQGHQFPRQVRLMKQACSLGQSISPSILPSPSPSPSLALLPTQNTKKLSISTLLVLRSSWKFDLHLQATCYLSLFISILIRVSQNPVF